MYVAGVLDSCFGQVLIPLPFLRQVKQTEDTITLLVEWESLTPEKRKGTAGMSPVLSFPLKLWQRLNPKPARLLPLISIHRILDSAYQEWCPLGAILPLHGLQG